MEVMYAFLCDYADNTGGKLHALGIGIDSIYAQSVPATHTQLFAVLALRFSPVEIGQKRLGLHIIDADGKDVIPALDATINVESPPTGYTYRVQRIALGLRGVQFPAYGDYSVSWLVDGSEVKTVPLKVAPPPAPPTTA